MQLVFPEQLIVKLRRNIHVTTKTDPAINADHGDTIALGPNLLVLAQEIGTDFFCLVIPILGEFLPFGGKLDRRLFPAGGPRRQLCHFRGQ